MSVILNILLLLLHYYYHHHYHDHHHLYTGVYNYMPETMFLGYITLQLSVVIKYDTTTTTTNISRSVFFAVYL
jgi:hypothetical protein